MWRVGPVPSMPAGQLRERSIKHDRAVTTVGRVAMYTPPNVIAFTWAEHDWLAVRNVSGQLVEAASAPSPRCELHRDHHGWLAPLTDCREPLRQARSNGWRKHSISWRCCRQQRTRATAGTWRRLISSTSQIKNDRRGFLCQIRVNRHFHVPAIAVAFEFAAVFSVPKFATTACSGNCIRTDSFARNPDARPRPSTTSLPARFRS